MGITPLSKAQIFQSIKNFLEQESSPPKRRQCRGCGSPMQLIDAHFLLRGTAMNRKVSLPARPVCDREILEKPARPETIH